MCVREKRAKENTVKITTKITKSKKKIKESESERARMICEVSNV